MAVVKRSDYWNPATNGPFTSPTGKGESYTDIEQYLMPVGRQAHAALHGWGVGSGLEVRATVGDSSATISTGVAFDAAGRAIVLTPAGLAITDPEDDPASMPNVAPVTLTQVGLTFTTTDLAPGLSSPALLTLSWREVKESGQYVLLHTPWVRLVPAAGFQDVGEQVVLAAVSLGTDGVVNNLQAGPRRLVGLPTDRLELRRPRTTSGTVDVAVDQVASGIIAATRDGGIEISLLGPDDASGVAEISIDAAGDVALAHNFRVADRFIIDGDGNANVKETLTIARLSVNTSQPARQVHVEGTEVHSGGSGGGFSFTDRNVGDFVEIPDNGERWVWYGLDGAAHLWSGFDRLTVSAVGEGGGLDVSRRMRVRQGGDSSAGIWLNQDGVGDRGFVGMLDNNAIGLFGNAGAGWGLTVNVATAELNIQGPAIMRAGARVVGNATVGAGGNGVLTTRHVNGKSGSNDDTDDLYLNWDTGRGVHVGGAQEASFEVVGNATVRRGLSVGGATGLQGLSVGGNQYVAGTIIAHTQMSFPPWSGGGVGTWDVFARGGVYVGSDPANPKIKLWENGTITAVTKRFVIDHPLDPEHKSLQHISIEGPEAGVYYRGEGTLAAGRARVLLPEYFEALTRMEGRTVMVTPLCTHGGTVGALGATRVTGGGFDVVAGSGTDPDQGFCWEVKAVRADVDRLVVETDKTNEAQPTDQPIKETA